MEESEKTPAGDQIYRYTEPQHQNFEPPTGDGHVQEISDHIEKYLGPAASVFHEIISPLVHIDVYYIRPNDNFPFHIMVTSGMSDKPMTVPAGLEDNRYAELCILLPKSWPIYYEDYKLMTEVFKDENCYWPVRWLKTMARFPHEYNTWLGWGHTIPNGENAEPYADNTKFGCMMLYPAISLPRDFFELKTKDNITIKFYCLYPLYKEEMDYKLDKGVDMLLEKFDKYKIRDVLNINRPNTCLKKGLLGLW